MGKIDPGFENWAATLEDPEFETLTARLIRNSSGKRNEKPRLAVAAVAQLSAADLPRLKRTRRLTYLLAQLNLSTEELRALTEAVRAMSPQAKSLYASASRSVELAALYTKPGEPTPAEASAKPDSGASQSEVTQSHLDAKLGATALVLAMEDFQAGSKSILWEAGVAAVRVQSIEFLEQSLRALDDVCAVLIDKSFMKTLEADEQRSLFEKIGAYSSLIWIRIDADGLKISQAEVESILQLAVCKSEMSSHSLSFGSTGNLRQSELNRVERACALVKSSDRGVVLPADLAPPELRVVMAAAADYLREWRSGLSTDLRLRTKLIPGGRTNAKIVLARLDERDEPFVVKVDRREFIHEEMVRFKSFIERGDAALQPRAVFHGGYGAIVFRLIEGADEFARPAPKLEHALKEIKFHDLYQLPSSHQPLSTAASIQTVVSKLSRLNIQSPNESDLRNYSTPVTSTFERLEAAGNGFGFNEPVVESRRLAVLSYQRLDGRATVHGDINLRNILLSGRENASLIDYANSGPGHPAVDLVRLESALLFGAFVLSVDLELFRRLQQLLTIELATLDEIHAEIPEVLRMTVNETVLRGCVAARDAALTVLAHYGGDKVDYRAAKNLIAWASLEVEGLQHALARETIVLLSEATA